MRFTILYVITCLLLSLSGNAQDSLRWKWKYVSKHAICDIPCKETGFIVNQHAKKARGKLILECPKGTHFNNRIEQNINIKGLPYGITPRIRYRSARKIEISLRIKENGLPLHTVFIDIQVSSKGINGYLPSISLKQKNIPVFFINIPKKIMSPSTQKEYLLIFHDEFNDSSLNQKKWETYQKTFKRVNKTISYQNKTYTIIMSDSACQIHNDQLYISVSKEGDNIYSGGITTHTRCMPKYGYFETRCRFENKNSTGYWPAFWIYPQEKDLQNFGTEYDIFEYLPGENKIYQSIHYYDRKGELYSSSTATELLLPDSSHIFALEWTNKEIIFYIDHQITRRISYKEHPRLIAHTYQFLVLSISAGLWGGNIASANNPLPATVSFDYVRIYQQKKDKSDYTGKKIKANKIFRSLTK